MKRVKSTWTVMFLAAFLAAGCGDRQQSVSDPFVSDVEHTKVKGQKIGNCWLYAAASWTESLHLSATGNEFNASESYWTWWHWYDQLTGWFYGDEIRTGGNWSTSTRIIMAHGVISEADFIYAERNEEFSKRQLNAKNAINLALQEGGALATREQRTPENVRIVLDQAWKTNMAEAEAKAIPASEFLTAVYDDDTEAYLSDNLTGDSDYRWRYVSYPQLSDRNARPNALIKRQRRALLKRVFQAVNDYEPVVISTMIDFFALDITDTKFKLSTLQNRGEMGTQGGHMLVLEDYAVTNVRGIGSIGEGDVSDRLKAKAVNGTLDYLVTKNSWGTKRADRGLTDGYSRFELGYLDATLPWKYDNDNPENVYYSTTLSGFVLPPNY